MDEFFGKEWEGQVEVFAISGHPSARSCYAWFAASGEIITMLQISPVISVRTAVREALRIHRN